MTDAPVRLLFHPFLYLPEAWNGIDEHLLALCRHLDRDRFEPLVLVRPDDGPQTATLAERAGIPAVPAPYPAHTPPQGRLRPLRRLYRELGVDLLHIHTPVAGGQAVPTLAARLAGARATVITYHQIQPARLPTKSLLLNAATGSLLLDGAMAVSGGVKRSLVASSGLGEGQIDVVLNGIDVDTDPPGPPRLPPPALREVRLAYFGRLSAEKGVGRLLEMLALVVKEHPDVTLLIVGDGPERAALERAAAELGVSPNVDFLGFRSDARALMHEVDVVVHAPVYEGFGLVVLEAMAAARPVVANDAPGAVPDMVVNGETGTVVPGGAPDDLAAAVSRLVGDGAERRRLGENGRRRLHAHFTATRMADLVAEEYERALRRGAGLSRWRPRRRRP